jgi:hypothetical protein
MTASNPMPPPSQKLVDQTDKMQEPWYRYFNTERLATDETNSFPWLNVKDYGALGDGASDDTDAVQAAIADVPVSGGTVYFPKGVYMVRPDSITIGNGSAAALSVTGNNLNLLGEGYDPFYAQYGTVLKATSAGSIMLAVNGPVNGISIKDMFFHCDNKVNQGWNLESVSNSHFSRFEIYQFKAYGIFGDCNAYPLFGYAQNNNFNEFVLSSSVVADFGAGLLLNGSTAAGNDWHHCYFGSGYVLVNGGSANATNALDLRFCDSNTWVEVDCIASTGGGLIGNGALFAETLAAYPQNNFFYGCSIQNTTVSGTIGRNYFTNYCTRDSEVIPTSTYLIGYTDQGQFFGEHTFRDPPVSRSTVAASTTATASYLMGNTTTFGIYFGSGAPTAAAGQGSLYLRTDGATSQDRAFINTAGTTVWTGIRTTA